MPPPFPAARGRKSAAGKQPKLKPGNEPPDKIYAKEQEQQATKKKHVVESTHEHQGLK